MRMMGLQRPTVIWWRVPFLTAEDRLWWFWTTRKAVVTWCEKLRVIQPCSSSEKGLPYASWLNFGSRITQPEPQKWFPSRDVVPKHLALSASELTLHQETARAPLEEMSTIQGQSHSQMPLLRVWSLTSWQELGQFQFLSNLRWEGRERRGGLCRP